MKEFIKEILTFLSVLTNKPYYRKFRQWTKTFTLWDWVTYSWEYRSHHYQRNFYKQNKGEIYGQKGQ